MLIDDQCEKAQAAVGSTMPKQEGLGCLRKLAEHEPGSEQPSVIYPVVPAWVSALTSLSDEL